MHYTETKIENGTRIKLRLTDRVVLLETDIDELMSPDTLPNAHQIASLIHRAQIIGNNIRRCKQELNEHIVNWSALRDRIQRAVGSSDAISYSDTGNKRGSLRHLISATWGPINIDVPNGEQGIKEGLLKIEYDSAIQLASAMGKVEGEEIKRTKFCYDDIVRVGECTMSRLSALERDLEVRHYDFNNLVKLIEIEAFEARKQQLTIPPATPVP